MIRVTLYSDASYFGGAERYLAMLARYLDRARFDVSAIVPDVPGAITLENLFRDAGVPVSYAPVPGFTWYRKMPQMVRAFRETPGDVLHINLPSTYDAGVSSVALAARWAGYERVVTTEHLPMIDRKYKKFPIKYAFTHAIDAVISGAKSNQPFLVEQHAVPEDKIWTIANGVEVPPKLSESEIAALRREWGVVGDELVLGVVARLTHRKGHHILLEAISRVPEVLSRSRLVFVGEGEEEVALRALADRLGVSDRVHWTGLRNDAASLPQAFDLFVLPSIVETMPLSIAEAMADGAPILATAIYGVPEIIVHEESGVLIPSEDVDALAAALVRLASDRKELARLGRAARERYDRAFTAQIMADKTSDVYLGVEGSR